MPRVRGRQRGVYTTDGGTAYVMQVDSDRFLVADFGWTAPTGRLNQLPRGAKPRHVRGLSSTSGRYGTAVVPDVASAIWTGTATTFEVEADDGTIDTMTVTQLIAERPSLA